MVINKPTMRQETRQRKQNLLGAGYCTCNVTGSSKNVLKVPEMASLEQANSGGLLRTHRNVVTISSYGWNLC